jgi:hypothetical protein
MVRCTIVASDGGVGLFAITSRWIVFRGAILSLLLSDRSGLIVITIAP